MRVELEQSLQERVKLLIDQGKIFRKRFVLRFDLSNKALNNWGIQGLQIFLGNCSSELNYFFQLFQHRFTFIYLDIPSKSGFPVSNSAAMQPTLHQSAG